jgi:D-3-phosphoglycerate dehydrogenase
VSVDEADSPRLVLVTDAPWGSTEPEAAILERVGARLVHAEHGDEAELLRLVPTADAILTCFERVTPAVVRAGARLQVIGRYGIGVDNIAVAEATARGIPVTNVPDYCADEVAEHVLALIFAHERGLLRFAEGVRSGDWSVDRGLPLRRVAGRTLGIVGFGRIGSALSAKVAGLGLQLLVYDRSADATTLAAVGAAGVELGELARRSDYVSIHLPLTAETRALVSGELLAQMKPDTFLVNCARGAIVDQDALLDALRAGRLGGAGLDVFEPERLPDGHPLLTDRRVVATPHVAYYSKESILELQTRAAENVAAILDGRRPASIVNPEVLGS